MRNMKEIKKIYYKFSKPVATHGHSTSNLRYSCLNRDRFGKTKTHKRKRGKGRVGLLGWWGRGMDWPSCGVRARVIHYPPLLCGASGWSLGRAWFGRLDAFSFLFLFYYFFHNFCILAPNELKPISKIF
jgi:hypothetical protein